jgi:hypothetical protein
MWLYIANLAGEEVEEGVVKIVEWVDSVKGGGHGPPPPASWPKIPS